MSPVSTTPETIFNQAIAIADATDRAAFLDRSCANDPALRSEIEKLVNDHFRAGDFLEQPAVQLGVTAPQPAIERQGTQIGPYRLLQQIGEGGMGVVYMAEQLAPVERKVALKIIKPGMDSRQVIARFEAERQALALMDHPNIARVLDAGTTGPEGGCPGQPYFVMELVKGVPITQYCDERRLTPLQRLELFLPVCHAVQHAHQKGIIHRDIKPSNVLVAEFDEKPVAKIIDFGVAKAIGQRLTEKPLFTEFGQVVGTIEYMSPEQAKFNQLDIDTRTDVYALGVLLYELLTGETPFDRQRLRGAAFDEMLRIIREEEPPKPSTRLSGSGSLPSAAANRHLEPGRLTALLRGELDWIVMKALEKDRSRRYETANGLAMDVQRYLKDEPVQACPPSALYRFRKFGRRNKAALVIGTVVALAICAAAGTLVVSNIRISGESAEKAKALEAATTSQQEAQESLKDALAAVDQMLTRVSEERLQDIPQMEPVRRDLLLDALKFYQKFLEKRSDDPRIRRETALAYRRMASLHFGLGDYRKSEDAYRKAFAMLDELEAESPLEPSIRNELVSHYIGFSWVLTNQGKFEESEKALRRAVATAEDLVKKFPEAPLYRDHLVEASNRLAYVINEPEEADRILRRNLVLTENTDRLWDRAQTYQNLGVLLANQRRFLEAEEACRQGVLFFEKALAKSPSSRSQQVELADTLKQLAKMVETNGRPEEAEEICQRAIPMFDKFATDFPTGPHNRWGQADIYFQQALLLKKLKRLTEAEQAYRRTVELFDKLVTDFPTLPGYMATAVDRRLHLAQFLLDTRRDHEAQQVSDEASAILEKLAARDRSQALTMRGYFYAGLGEWNKAAADLTKAIELGSDDVLGVWCPLALVQLGAGRTDEYRSVCEKMLERSESHWIVGTCTLAPKAVADLARPVRIAEKLVAREPKNAEFIAVLGFALYRKGDMQSAVQSLQVSIHSDPHSHDVQASKLVLAMAYHRLGRGAEAQQLFQEVTRWMEANSEKLKEGVGASMPPAWAYRLSLQLLHREAEELLKQDFGGKSQK